MDKKQERRARRKDKKIKQQKRHRVVPTAPTTTNMAKFKPKYGQLPDKQVMDVIAESLHEAVTTVFDELEQAGVDTGTATHNAKIKGRCLYYAGAGQHVAERILGRQYWVQVGSLGVSTDSEKMFKIDAANGGVAARRFHMWFGTDEGGVPEFVDFTSRFFKEWASDSGINWERDGLPDYLWGSQIDFAEKHGVYYKLEPAEEAEADKQIQVNQKILDVIEERAVALAIKRLAEMP